jgi:hypothetical protein
MHLTERKSRRDDDTDSQSSGSETLTYNLQAQ